MRSSDLRQFTSVFRDHGTSLFLESARDQRYNVIQHEFCAKYILQTAGVLDHNMYIHLGQREIYVNRSSPHHTALGVYAIVMTCRELKSNKYVEYDAIYLNLCRSEGSL